MDLGEIVRQLQPLADSQVAAALITTFIAVPLGSFFGLRAYRQQARELIDGAVAWRWVHGYNGKLDEEPFLVVQNRSPVPAYMKQARYLRGVLIRTEARKFPFSYDEPTDENFPLEITSQSVTAFPLSRHMADKIVARAPWYARLVCRIGGRSYLWVEITTISGHRMIIAANDATSFQDRPAWLDGRWFPEPKPDWASLFNSSPKDEQ